MFALMSLITSTSLCLQASLSREHNMATLSESSLEFRDAFSLQVHYELYCPAGKLLMQLRSERPIYAIAVNIFSITEKGLFSVYHTDHQSFYHIQHFCCAVLAPVLIKGIIFVT